MVKTHREKRKGFTLIETMVVVSIIAILVTIAIPNFLRSREEAKAKLCIANLKQIDTAKKRWACAANAGSTEEVYTTDIAPYYIKVVPPTCLGNGVYTLGAVQETLTCSIGTNNTQDVFDDHMLPY